MDGGSFGWNENTGATGRAPRRCEAGPEGGGDDSRAAGANDCGTAAGAKDCGTAAGANDCATGTGAAGSGVAEAWSGAAATRGIPFGGVGATTRGERSLRPQS